jgi:hypothetical protein
MMFALVLTAFIAGLAAAIACWPFFGASAFFMAPFAASLATFAAAALLARRKQAPVDSIDAITDRLVAELRTMAQTASRPEQALPELDRKVG